MSNKFQEKYNNAQGNALIYVLIAIALFAGLSFTLSRQSRNSGTSEIDDAKAELYAMQLITHASQVKSIIEQMSFTGSNIDDLIFTKPSEAGFSNAPYIHKVYHPQGGGLTAATIPAQAIYQISSTPPAGWYLDRFNNVEWTKTAGTDVMLTAYQISRAVCEKINKKIIGSISIPALSGDMSEFLLNTASNSDLTIASCAACEGYISLCVSNNTATAYSFYSVILDR